MRKLTELSNEISRVSLVEIPYHLAESLNFMSPPLWPLISKILLQSTFRYSQKT